MTHLRFNIDKLVYSDKRKTMTKNALVSIGAIICALIFALIITIIVYRDASLFYKIIRDIFVAPFKKLNAIISSVSIFIIGGLSFVFAFRAGLFNIGISGQMLFGAILAVVMSKFVGHVPNGLGQIIMLLIAIMGGMIVASLIGVLKAFFNLNEVVASIMLNWIIYFAGTYLLIATNVPLNSSGDYTASLSSNLILRNGSNSWLPLLIIALICTTFIIVLLGSTTIGKKIIHSGMSTSAAKYAGYNVKFNQIMAMTISGALAGIMGMMVYCGYGVSMPVTPIAKTIPVEGFNGISVGLIAMSNPWAIVPVSVFFGMIDSAKSTIMVTENIDGAITDLMFGIVVYGAAIVSLFYYIVPFKWYLRLFKNKQYTKAYINYVNVINEELEQANNALYYLKKYSQGNVNNFEYEKDSFVKFNITFNKKISKQEYQANVNHIYSLYALYKKYHHCELMIESYKESNKNIFSQYSNMKKKICSQIKLKGGKI